MTAISEYQAVSEKAFMQSVIELARVTGWLCYHTHDSRRSQAGFPDCVLVRGERLVCLELKTERGRLRPEQKVWLAALAKTEAEVCLVRPSQWESLVELLSPRVLFMDNNPSYERWYE